MQGYTLQDLLKEAEKIFNKRETQEEREDHIRREKEEREDRLRKEAEEKENARDRKRNRELNRILATAVQGQDSRKAAGWENEEALAWNATNVPTARKEGTGQRTALRRPANPEAPNHKP